MTYRRKKTHNRIDSKKELVRVILSDRMNPKGRTMCQKKKQTKTTWAGPAYRKGIFLVAWLCSCVGVRSLCCLISSYIINTTCCHHIWSSTHTHTHRASNVSHEIIRSVQGKVKKMWEKWASKNKMWASRMKDQLTAQSAGCECLPGWSWRCSRSPGRDVRFRPCLPAPGV